MKHTRLSKFLLLISVFSTGHILGGEPPLGLERGPKFRVPPVYYDLLGFKKELNATTKAVFESLERMPAFINLTAKIIPLNNKVALLEEYLAGFEADLKKAPPPEQKELQKKIKKYKLEIKEYKLELEELERERQKLGQDALAVVLARDIPKSEIEKRCKEKRKELQRKREGLERDLGVERLSFEVRRKKTKELADVQYEIEQTAHACPLLLDDRRRQAYDFSLAALHEESKGLIDGLRKGIQKAKDDPPDMFIKANDLAGELLVDKLNPILQDLFSDAPAAVTKIFNQEIALRSIEFLPKPGGQDVRYWVGFSGLMRLNRFDVRVSMYIVQDIYGVRRVSCSVELPKYYKLSNLIPGFTYLDTLPFPKGRLVFSNFSYFDRVAIRKGLTFVAEVDLSGPLKVLSDLKDKSKYTKSLIFENEPVVGSLYLPKALLKDPAKFRSSRFEVRVPFHFGFDFRQMSLMPKSVSQVINQVTTDDLRLEVLPRESKREEEEREEPERKKSLSELPFFEGEKVAPKRTLKETELAKRAAEEIKPFYKEVPKFGPKKEKVRKWGQFARFNIEAEWGARIVLGTQKDPLQLTLLGAIKPAFPMANSSLLVAANMKKMLQLKWLAFGDASIQFEWDTALMAEAAALGIPFTGFGIRGRLDLGKPGASRAHLGMAAGLKVAAGEKPGLLVNLSGSNIRFADLLSYASYLAAKARILKQPFPVEKIPTMTFKHVEGYASLADMRIGGEFYPAGIGLHVEMELFKKKFGLKVDMSNEFQLSGFGYMPRIDATIKGHQIFKLYDSAKPDRGPRAAFAFDPKKPLEGYFNMSGAFEIPAIRLKHDAKFIWSGWSLDAEIESTLAGIAIWWGVRINLRPTLRPRVPVAAPGAAAAAAAAVGEEEEEEEEGEAEGEGEILKKLPSRLAEIKKVEPRQQMYVKFGFKQEFAEYMTKVSKPLFQKMRTSASKKLKAAMDTMLELKARGVKGFEAEIERARRSVARTEEKLKQAQEVCAKSRWYKKYKCAQVGALKAVLLSKKSYLNGLLKPTKAVATGAAKVSAAVVRKTVIVQEIALEVATVVLEIIKEGLNLFTLKEFLGEFSSQDIAHGKLATVKRLIVEVNITGEPIVISLYDIPFDLKHPFQAIEQVTRQVARAFLGKNMQYVERVESMVR